MHIRHTHPRATFIAFASFTATLVAGLTLRAADPTPAAPVDLGGPLVLPTPSQLVWQTTSTSKQARWDGVEVVPQTRTYDKSESRHLTIDLLTPTQRTLTVTAGHTTQTYTDGTRINDKLPDNLDQPHPLLNQKILGQKTADTWTYTLATGTPTPAQQRELDKLARRATDESNLFSGLTATLGQPFTLDPARFLRFAGFDDMQPTTGTATATLIEVRPPVSPTLPDAEPLAVFSLKIDLQATQKHPPVAPPAPPATPTGQPAKPKPPVTPETQLDLKCTGTLQHGLTTHLARDVTLTGTLELTGTVSNGYGGLWPYTTVIPIDTHSTRTLTVPIK